MVTNTTGPNETKAAAQKLAAQADKAKAAAVLAKQQVREAKATLKRARKAAKAAKKTAKDAARKAAEALSLLARSVPIAPKKAPAAPDRPPVARKKAAAARLPMKPVDAARVVKAPKKKSKGLPARSAAEVARSVIERLQAPPPTLPPEPNVPVVDRDELAAPAPAAADKT